MLALPQVLHCMNVLIKGKNNLEDIELIKSAKGGNEKALDELYDKYKRIVLLIAKKYYLVDGNNDDIVQEGMFGFLKAVNTFDETKCEWVPYLRRLVEQQILNAIKKSHSYKNFPLNEGLSLNNQGELSINDAVVSIPSTALSPELEVINEENSKNLNELISNKLSNFEQQVLQLYLDGYKYNDIIKKLNVTYKSVDNALSRIKQKLQNFKKED